MQLCFNLILILKIRTQYFSVYSLLLNSSTYGMLNILNIKYRIVQEIWGIKKLKCVELIMHSQFALLKSKWVWAGADLVKIVRSASTLSTSGIRLSEMMQAFSRIAFGHVADLLPHIGVDDVNEITVSFMMCIKPLQVKIV